MADHLRLPPGYLLDSRRIQPPPQDGGKRFSRRAHGTRLAGALASLEPEQSLEQEDDQLPLVLKFRATTRLKPGPLHRLDFETLGEGRGWTYFVLASRESREQFVAVLRDYVALPDQGQFSWNHPKTWAELVDNIEGIELYGPEDRADPSIVTLAFTRGVETVDCLLWPTSTAAEALRRVDEIAAVVEQFGADDQRVRTVASDRRPDRVMVRVVVTRTVLAQLLDDVLIERIRSPLRTSFTQQALYNTTLPADVPPMATTPIAVIDGVINSVNPLTAAYIRDAANFPVAHVFSRPDQHGTTVAGNAIWGDLDPFVTGGKVRTPHPVVSARVLDVQRDGNLIVAGIPHETIEDAIRWTVSDQDVRIINLSINRDYPASDEAQRDELTYTLDTLARELGVVIVVSAGNRGDPPPSGWHAGYPGYLVDDEAGIAAPGDGALVVTVGSHARRDIPERSAKGGDVPIAAVNEPSPFTRTGPTRAASKDGTLKPEFVHHGGNWSWNSHDQDHDGEDPGLAAIVAIPPMNGRIVGAQSGTSVAAPSVAHETARIAERYPGAGPNLLRALLALSARPTGREFSSIEGYRWRGYGVPDSDRVLESSPQRVFLVIEESMDTDRVVLHQLPIPIEFAEQRRHRTFRVALAFDPPVRRNRREYIAGTMQVELVRGLSLDQVEAIYTRQPSEAQVEADPRLQRHKLPERRLRPNLDPGANTVMYSTLIRREYLNRNWDPEHQNYFLVVTHKRSPWTQKQRNEYKRQAYALAVEIADETRTDLDLYALMRSRLQARARVRR